MRFVLFFLSIISLPTFVFGFDEPDCDTLNHLYATQYIEDFHVNRRTFEIDIAMPIFECTGNDKNYKLARAIHDIDVLGKNESAGPDWYAMVAMVMDLTGGEILYHEKFKSDPYIDGTVIYDDEFDEVSLFFTKRIFQDTERTRVTYSLIHEVRHMIINLTINGKEVPDEPQHVTCTQGRFKGQIGCDEVLGFLDTLKEGSGNSYEFQYLIYMRDHPDASPLMKKEARAQLRYLVRNMFNRIEPGALEHWGVSR
ncbi:MAG: hypothetical protein N4A61_01255 [Pelagimonas sp.]|jgi:hypothetical protein|nr:hypothetical protein [Pelagimonas sp.]